MSDDNVQNMTFELLKRVQSAISDMDARLSAGFGEVDRRLVALERFQGASIHGQQSIMAHLAGIHEAVDDLRAEVRAIKQRLDQVEAR